MDALPHEDPAALLRHVGADPGDADLAALACLAPRLRVLAHLPTPTAPGAVMIGGILDTGRSGPLSVSGVGHVAVRALAACLGELAEVLAQTPRPGLVVARGSLEHPPAGHGLGPRELRRAAERGLAPSRRVGWLRAVRLPDGAPCLLPAPLCLRDAAPSGEGPPSSASGEGPPSSAGCAAGPTLARARRTAALELVERAALAEWQRTGRGWGLDLEDARAAAAALDMLRGDAPRGWVRILHIGAAPAPPVVLARSALGQGVAAGETVRDAALGALREMVGAETGAIIAAARGAPRAALERLAVHAAPGTLAPLADTLARLAAAGVPMRAVDLTCAASCVPVVKVVCLGTIT